MSELQLSSVTFGIFIEYYASEIPRQLLQLIHVLQMTRPLSLITPVVSLHNCRSHHRS